MSVVSTIALRINRMAKGEPFHRKAFAEMGSPSAISKALAKMVQAGSLQRITRGVYMRPRWRKYIGQIEASPVEVMKVIAEANGEVIQTHGAEAVRRFRLSNQMQVVPVYYTSGATRKIRIGRTIVSLQHVSKKRLQYAGTNVGLALTALYYLGRKGVSTVTVAQICVLLTSDELATLRTCQMPQWMSGILNDFSGETAPSLHPVNDVSS